MIEFQPFPKLSRLRRNIVVTEKIDGTNAAVVIVPTGDADRDVVEISPDGQFVMLVQSRKRFITPGKNTDNMGFAGWCRDHSEDLFKLGQGIHYGEWWGQGVQRTYGLDHKRFSLFNVARWADGRQPRPDCCGVVPVLYEGPFDQAMINGTMGVLQIGGSRAAPGWMKPEGIVVFHTALGQGFKVTFEHDDTGKGQVDG